jgi:hypothetical protein
MYFSISISLISHSLPLSLCTPCYDPFMKSSHYSMNEAFNPRHVTRPVTNNGLAGCEHRHFVE